MLELYMEQVRFLLVGSSIIYLRKYLRNTGVSTSTFTEKVSHVSAKSSKITQGLQGSRVLTNYCAKTTTALYHQYFKL